MYKRTLVTAALPYANGPLHLGHLAGAYLPSDFFVRYRRLKKDDIVFICGSDEHGVAITIAAEKNGVKPEDIINKYHNINKDAFDQFGISFDFYGRTSSPIHHKTSQDFFTKLYNDDQFVERTEEQFFDESAHMFLPDRYVKGECPNCSFQEAYGDQCENCGSSLSPTDLINPVSAISGNKPKLKSTSHWFLPLGKLQPNLEEWLKTKSTWKANVKGQVDSWLKNGLQDRAITRDLDWGVKVPLENADGKVLYVWLDAPIGYISATKEWAIEKGNPELWESYWKSDDTQLIHFIGKDNIVFHCIMFPSILQAHGDFVLPDNVPANEFLNLEGRKFSTSRGWAVWLHDYLDVFEPDLLRYTLGSILPEQKDADFSWRDFQTRVNSELADILGNFIYRTLSFLIKYFEGAVPEPKELLNEDLDILNSILTQRDTIEKKFEKFQFRDAIQETMKLARIGNKYFTDKEPWKSRKTNMQDCGNTLYVCSQLVAAISILFKPILPFSMKKLQEQIHFESDNWNFETDQLLNIGHKIELGEVLFTKIEDDIINQQLEKLDSTLTIEEDQTNFEPLKDAITFDDFMKMDIRTGKVLEAEKLAKSKKLLKLSIDLGFETRTILSGVAEYIKPEDLIGKQLSVLANLKPRKIMGIESNGMILFAENQDGELKIVESFGEPGSQIA